MEERERIVAYVWTPIRIDNMYLFYCLRLCAVSSLNIRFKSHMELASLALIWWHCVNFSLSSFDLIAYLCDWFCWVPLICSHNSSSKPNKQRIARVECSIRITQQMPSLLWFSWWVSWNWIVYYKISKHSLSNVQMFSSNNSQFAS